MIAERTELPKYWNNICRAYDSGQYHMLMGPHLRRFWNELFEVLKIFRNESFWKVGNAAREEWKTIIISQFGVSPSFFKDRKPAEVVTAIELRAFEKEIRMQAGEIPDFDLHIRKAMIPLYKDYLANPDSEEDLPF